MTSDVRIVGLGVDHRAAGSGFREGLAATWAAGVADAVGGGAATAGVALCTCLRVEAYLAADDPERCVEAVARSVSDRAGIARGALDGRLAVRTGRAAVEHVFSVAAGLESTIVGERQILDQLRAAWERARAPGPLDPCLDRLFQHAVATGKTVRRDTGIGRGARSIGDTAADLAARDGADLGCAAVAIVGAGTVARTTAVSLGRRGARTFAVVNRSPDGAAALAADLDRRGWDCEALPWEHLAQAAAAADVIVCATSAPGHVLRAADLPAGRRRVVVDLAMPRDVDPEVALVPATTLLDLDAVWHHAPTRGASAPADVEQARAIVNDRVEAYMRWMAERAAAPAIAELMRHTLRGGSTPASRRILHERTMALKRRAFECAGPRLEPEAAGR
jgi:glutamyl-tRNA reductase